MGWINLRIVRALTRRDLKVYFSNPTGYVFITLFIFLSAAAAFWQERFFLNNLANLDQLNAVFPLLLLLFVPALTMAVWAEERKLGTDELLLTLPATDLEIVLGKYLATLGVYTASVLLSLSHVLVLFWLGSPDPGLMLGNYAGYWLIGAALIAVGMLASLMTSNATIAYVLGAIFCAVFVGIGSAAGVLSDVLARLLSPLAVFGHFGDFARGVVSLSGLLYFLSVTGLLIYLNVLLIGKRHWPLKADGMGMSAHHSVRAVAVAIVLVSINAMVSRAGVRMDVTAEGLHSLSDETRRLIADLPEDRPVFVQAYVSAEVPEQFVQTRANLLGLLKEIGAVAGSKVQVLIQETEPFTEVARDARERFGIVSRQVPNIGSAKAGFSDVFMGVAVTCGPEEQVIPFFDRGLPVEYELARSIRVAARTDRKKIGVVNTQVRLFGGIDFQTMRNSPPWSIVEELRKQYEVVQLSPTDPITEEVDAIFVALPSSMTQDEMDNVTAYIESGHPALLLVDPLPIVNLGLAPSERPDANRNPFMSQGQPPPQPKGNIQGMLARLGVRWNPAAVIWDGYNPHPDLAHLPEEVVFVGPGNQNPASFNEASSSSRDLQEIVFLYPGFLQEAAGAGVSFEPLIRSSLLSGQESYFQLVQRSFFGVQLAQGLPHRPDGSDYIVAARVVSTGTSPAPAPATADPNADPNDGPAAAGGEEAGSKTDVNVIVVADLDFVSEQFFQIRQAGPANLNFDNVTFVLNAMDNLAGDESFINLRNRRLKHRTLERVEDQTRAYIEQRAAEEQQATEEADKALSEAQARLDEKVAEVRNRTDLDEQTKQIMARNLQEAESRKFEVLEASIKLEKEAKIARSKETMESQILKIQGGIRTAAVLLPPVPVFLLGVAIFFRRRRQEREGAAAAHRLRS
jgi:ABC-2 type transport system permease protein